MSTGKSTTGVATAVSTSSPHSHFILRGISEKLLVLIGYCTTNWWADDAAACNEFENTWDMCKWHGTDENGVALPRSEQSCQLAPPNCWDLMWFSPECTWSGDDGGTYDRQGCDFRWFGCACKDVENYGVDLNMEPHFCGGPGEWPTDWYGGPVCHAEFVENMVVEEYPSPETGLMMQHETLYITTLCRGPETVDDLTCDMACEYAAECTWDWMDDNGGTYDDIACMACRDACPAPEGSCDGTTVLHGVIDGLDDPGHVHHTGMDDSTPTQIRDLGMYLNNEHCEYVLSCPPDSIPSITFHGFDLEQNFDFVHVMEGNCDGSCQVNSFSGQEMQGGEDCNGACAPMQFADGNTASWLDGWEIPPTIDGTSRSMTVLLTTDGSVTYGGFDASFVCISTTPPFACPPGMVFSMTNSGENSFCITDLDGNGIDDVIDAEIRAWEEEQLRILNECRDERTMVADHVYQHFYADPRIHCTDSSNTLELTGCTGIGNFVDSRTNGQIAYDRIQNTPQAVMEDTDNDPVTADEQVDGFCNMGLVYNMTTLMNHELAAAHAAHVSVVADNAFLSYDGLPFESGMEAYNHIVSAEDGATAKHRAKEFGWMRGTEMIQHMAQEAEMILGEYGFGWEARSAVEAHSMTEVSDIEFHNNLQPAQYKSDLEAAVTTYQDLTSDVLQFCPVGEPHWMHWTAGCCENPANDEDGDGQPDNNQWHVEVWEWEECHAFGATQDPVDTWWWHDFDCTAIPAVCTTLAVDPVLCCTCVTDGRDSCPQECMGVPEECHGILTCDGVCSADINWDDHQQCETHIDE